MQKLINCTQFTKECNGNDTEQLLCALRKSGTSAAQNEQVALEISPNVSEKKLFGILRRYVQSQNQPNVGKKFDNVFRYEIEQHFVCVSSTQKMSTKGDKISLLVLLRVKFSKIINLFKYLIDAC
eukprot:TRINITY_DN5816_c0_g4_i1.p2 TRINITY_DN5816_c0_g4~~TRINITY_DN5816_c0_g4_i1.p2  ORF type:complete len:125 (-),score=0.67 TRINITY_DN5816_c0_g4_i1:228-602(-)